MAQARRTSCNRRWRSSTMISARDRVVRVGTRRGDIRAMREGLGFYRPLPGARPAMTQFDNCASPSFSPPHGAAEKKSPLSGRRSAGRLGSSRSAPDEHSARAIRVPSRDQALQASEESRYPDGLGPTKSRNSAEIPRDPPRTHHGSPEIYSTASPSVDRTGSCRRRMLFRDTDARLRRSTTKKT